MYKIRVECSNQCQYTKTITNGQLSLTLLHHVFPLRTQSQHLVHHTKNRVVKFRFIHYEEIVSRHFNVVINAILVGIEPLKTRHDVTKLDLTIPLLSFWCTYTDLSIQSMYIMLYMT